MKSMITHGLEKRFDKDLNITSRKIADEYILDPIRQDVGNLKSVYTLNDVGAFIWELIEGKRSISEIRDLIVEKFDVEKEEVEGEESKELKIEMGNICSLIKSETADIIALLKIKYNQFLSNIDPKMEIYVLVKMTMILDEHQHIKATKNDYLFIQKDEFVGVIDLNKNNALIIIYNTISNNILNSFNSFLRICYSVFVSNHGGFLFHAAGIGMEDKGYIFFGPSESGKTTVAKLSHKFKVLNDDTIIIKKNSGSYSAFGTPLSSSVDRRLNGRNDSMNIHGLFVLKKDKRIYFKKMNYRDSIVSFLSSIIDFPLMLKMSEYYQHQSPNIIKNQFVMSCNILEEIPCYEMHFTLNDPFWGRVQNGTF